MTKVKQMKKVVAGLSLGLMASSLLAAGQTVSADEWTSYPAPAYGQAPMMGYGHPAPAWGWTGAYGWQEGAWSYGYESSSAQAATVTSVETSSLVASSITSDSSSALAAAAANSSSSNLYPIGQCTWGVKELAPWASNYWGNGGDWAANAAADGFTVGTTPVVGAIAVWTDGGYGHVAYVTDVVSETSIQVLEANVNGNQTIANHRGYFDPTTAQGTVTYIYPAS